MAGETKQPIKKRKKLRKLDTEEEVVITLGKSPKVRKEEEVSIKVGKDKEEEVLEIDDDLEDDLDIDSELNDEFEEVEDIEIEDEDEDDDVVVISLGAPPKEKAPIKKAKKKKIETEDEIEEEIILAEPVEAEVVEEGEEPLKKAPEKDPFKNKKLIAIIIAIIVIFGSIGFYFILQNQNPKADLQLDPTTAMAGELITMDGSGSTDDSAVVRFDWDFGDGTQYTEESGNAKDGKFDKKTTHAYGDIGDYSITLTVWDDDGKKGTTDDKITISELVVIVPQEKIEDAITSLVNGTVDVYNPNGLHTESTDFADVKIERIEMTYEGTMDSSTEGTLTQEDGFGVNHQTLEKYNNQILDLEGTVSGTLIFPGSESPFDYQINQGSLTVEDLAYIDLTTNKTIFSKTVSDLTISAGQDLGISSQDTLRTYSNLRVEPAVLTVEDLSSDRTFRIGQKQTKIVGEIAYSWEVKQATNIQGYPALGINIDIDDGTKTDLGMQDFDMWLYITNGISFPIRTYVYAKLYTDGTTTEIVYNSEIDDEENAYNSGDQDIPWGTCTTGTPQKHYHDKNPGFEFVNWDITDDLPDIGSNSTDFDFPPQMAILDAQLSSSDFQNYLVNNPTAYVIDCYYNETQTNPLWNLTFGEFGDDTGYYVVVENTGTILEEDTIEIPELRNSSLDFSEVLSYSASQLVFQEDDVASVEAFDSNGVKYYSPHEFSYGSTADIVYPTLSLTVSLSIERAEYGYYLSNEGNTFSAAVDAINGQMIYTWEHSGDDVMSIIIGP
jgi:hypothetical protein